MHCKLCLDPTIEYVTFQSGTTHYTGSQIAQILTTYFDLELEVTNDIVCIYCWQSIQIFHEFSKRIIAKQKQVIAKFVVHDLCTEVKVEPPAAAPVAAAVEPSHILPENVLVPSEVIVKEEMIIEAEDKMNNDSYQMDVEEFIPCSGDEDTTPSEQYTDGPSGSQQISKSSKATAAKKKGVYTITMAEQTRSTSASRMKKLREKRKAEDPDFKAAESARIAELRRRKREQISESELAAMRLKERDRKRLQRARKRVKGPPNVNTL